MSFRLFILAFKWQIRISVKNYATWLNVLGFYVLFVLIFPLLIAPVKEIIQPIGTGIILTGALLANLLSLDKLFLTDIKECSIYDWLHTNIYIYIGAKVLVHWIFVFLPFLLITPILSLFLFFPLENLFALALILTLTTFILLGIGAVIAALTSGLNNANLLISFILIPLSLPVLLISAISLDSYASGFNFLPSLAFLSAILLIIFSLAPFAIVAGLKNSLTIN